MSSNLKITIIGAGPIAKEYIKVLQGLSVDIRLIGRGSTKVNALKNEFPEIEAYSGGVETWLNQGQIPSHAILALPIEHLAPTCKVLIEKGCKNILVEKPLSYKIEEIQEIGRLANASNASVSIAFNRRSYASVVEAKRLIQADGGILSFHFDFTEAIFRIDPKNYDNSTNHYWGIANSSHVIDTAFYLGGRPKNMISKQYLDAVPWHPSGSLFTGLGETIDSTPFTYHSNWAAPGKWNIEIMTANRKLLFSPMERLHQQAKGGFKVELVETSYELDVNYKPGFYLQTKHWLEGKGNLVSLSELEEKMSIYNQIFNY